MADENGEKPATRKDVILVRTELKEDIAKLDSKIDGVKSELKADFNRVAVEVFKTNGRIDGLERPLRKEIAANTDRVMNAIDGLAKLVQADNRAVTIHGRALTKHSGKLADHEKRLSSLESTS